jgi:phenylacetate-CoA ligase
VTGIQCREADIYHIQSEQVLTEIVSDQGQPSAVGETGEVVVTPLYGYATPLLRYRTGDYVEAGPRCSCGRVLPTISRIVGRREHMFERGDGTRNLPPIDRVLLTEMLGHDRWIIAQQSQSDLVFRHAGELIAAKRGKIRENLHSVLGDDYRFDFESVADLPLTSGGKRHFTVNEIP